MSRVPDTSALITEIREQSNEKNQAAISDEGIVRVINRGLRFVVSELARRWDEPLVVRAIYTNQDYDPVKGLLLPEDIFENRVTYVQMDTPSTPTPIPFRSYTDVSALLSKTVNTQVPQAVFQRGNALFFAPHLGSRYSTMVDYIRLPDSFVLPIGRINVVDTEHAAVILDGIQLDRISAASDQRLSYVNVIDGLTGVIKGTMQVARIDNNKVSFRVLNLTRTTVEGRPVTADFVEVDPQPDDWLCGVEGTCIPQIGQFGVTYLVQYAVAEIDRALGDAALQISNQISLRAEAAAEQQRAGRPNVLRVKNRSKVWGFARSSSVWPYTSA